MHQPRLFEVVERNSQGALSAYNALEGALNLLLPDSGELHQRYQGIGEVGLAVVVARDMGNAVYSPLDTGTYSRVSFMADNQSLRPSAWEAKETDAETLGGVAPSGIGRFTAFALAKINHLSSSSDVISFDPDKLSIAPGMVGLAGGIHTSNSLTAASGLWEVHDHIAIRAFAQELLSGEPINQNSDEIAARIEPVLFQIKKAQSGVPAEELDRQQYMRLLLVADGMMEQRQEY